jgi:type I restriction enzyme, S subunit
MKPYPAYKYSGIEWIGEIPKHWEVKKLKYVASIQPSNVDKKSYDDELPVLLCNYIDVYNNDYIDDSIQFMKATASKEEIKKFKIMKGDVLATKDSETPDDIANPALVIADLNNVICGYHLAQIRANVESLLGEYLFRLFQSKRFNGQFEVGANGITRYGLSVSAFTDAFVVLPGLDEQQAIARYLDDKTKKIDTLIEMKQRLIELLKEQRTAIINQVITKGLNPKVKMKDSGIDWLGEIPEHWKLSRLKHIVQVKDGTHETPQYVEPSESSFPFITSKDIKEDQIDFSYAKYISKSDYIQFNKRSDVTKGDIIMPMIGTVGNPALVETDRPFSIKNVALFKTSESPNDGKYLLYFLRSNVVMEQFDLLSRGGVQGFVSQDVMKNLFAFSNELDEQVQIREYIDSEMLKIDKAVNGISALIEKLQEYRTTLISEVVTGKIDVREKIQYKEVGETFLLAAEKQVGYKNNRADNR